MDKRSIYNLSDEFAIGFVFGLDYNMSEYIKKRDKCLQKAGSNSYNYEKEWKKYAMTCKEQIIYFQEQMNRLKKKIQKGK